MPARWIVGLVVLALVVAPGCSDESDRGVGSSVESVPSPTEPSGPSLEVALDAADSELALSLSDLAVGPDGRVYVAGPAGVAVRAPDGAWGALDLAQLPPGSGSPWPPDWPTPWPGRDIALVEVGPDGQLWLAGVSFSHADDERFGGELNPPFDARFLHWMAVGRCDGADVCQWEVFDSDDVPGLAVRALAVGPNGAAYVASADGAILVFDGHSWTAHAAPSGDIESLAVTADGVLWAGATSGGGLFSFDGTEFTRRPLDDVVTGAEEITVDGAHGATVWVSADTMNGSGTGTVVSFDGTGWVVHDESDGMWSDHAGIAVGSGDMVWAVHDDAGHGYSRYEGARWTGFPSSQPVGGGGEVAPDGTLWTIAIDPDHADAVPETWLVSFDGVSETVHDSPFTGTPQSGTIAVALEEVTGLVGHRLLALAWQAPYADLVGAAFWTRADSDPFSSRDVVHPPDWSNGLDRDDDLDGWAADDYRWEETATLRPGRYRVDVYAHPGELKPYGSHLPAEPIDRQCFVEVDVRAGETTAVTIFDVPVTAEPSPCPGATSGRQPASTVDPAPGRMLWFSTDGNEWELVSDHSPFGRLSDVSIDGHAGIAERNGRYMAIGEIGGQGVADIRSATWASDDGLTWTTIDPPLERAEQLIAGEMGWMLSGVDHTGSDRDDAWFSLDGLAWDGPYLLPDGFSGLRPGWIPPAHDVGPDAIISVGGADNRSVLIVGRQLDPET